MSCCAIRHKESERLHEEREKFSFTSTTFSATSRLPGHPNLKFAIVSLFVSPNTFLQPKAVNHGKQQK